MLIHQNSLKRPDVDKLYIDKLRSVPKNLSILKIKVNKLLVNKFVAILLDLSKLSDVVKNHVYNAISLLILLLILK